MAALLGLEVADAHAICAEAAAQAGKPVIVANDNCPGQIVISGDEAALDLALPLAKAKGAKRAVKLAVSVAAHSPLMAQAAEFFSKALAETAFTAPRIPVIANLTATPLHTAAEIRAELTAQLTGAVRWTETIRALRALGATHFLELGPKDVLTGLLKRIDKDAVGLPLNSAAAVWALEIGG
jgi:[acyl-carrier-protein] S-malonyltransferase